MEKPFLKFYTRDWQSDSALRQCSASARGVWIELLCIMAQNDNDTCGYLCSNGRLTEPLNLSVIQRLTGLLKEEIESGLAELERNGVFSRNNNGVVFSRRLVKESSRSRINKENGSLGGNPALKVGITEPDNQKPNPHGNIRDQKLEVKLETKLNPESGKEKENTPPPENPNGFSLAPEKPEPAPRKRAAIPYEEIVAEYNRICKSLRRCDILNEERRKAIAGAWKILGGDMGQFILLFEKAQASAFLRGEKNDPTSKHKNWRADISFVLKDDKLPKIIEGGYDDGKAPAGAQDNDDPDKEPEDDITRLWKEKDAREQKKREEEKK